MTPFPLLHPIEPVELAPGVSMSFQVIPPVAVQQEALTTGQPLSFLMGSRRLRYNEEPRHRVVIPQPFYLGTFPVTQEEFACFRPLHKNGFPQNLRNPVEKVNWDDAKEFLHWINKHMRLSLKYEARLPCEAEWEYACRAGTETEFHSGDGEGALREAGWYTWNAGHSTHPVGMLQGNPWGLYDMHGNVWEWCDDVYDANAYAKRGDGWVARPWTQWDAGEDAEVYDADLADRSMRGGSWNYTFDRCRAEVRGWRPTLDRNWHQGFRVLLSPVDGADSGLGNAVAGRIG